MIDKDVIRVLRVVTLASKSGKYGGPFDTSLRQAQIYSRRVGSPVALLAGHLEDDEPTSWPDGVSYVGARVTKWGPASQFSMLCSWRYLRCAWRQIGMVDVVHVSFARDLVPILALVVSLIRGKGVVLQPHGMLTSRTSRVHRVMDRVIRPLAVKAGVFVALTAREHDQIRVWLGDDGLPIAILGNPLLDPSATAGRSREQVDLDVSFCARLHPRKRVVDFISGAEVAAKRGWQEIYHIIGPDGGDLESVESAAASSPNLKYHGAVPSNAVGPLIRRSSVFVLCSLEEPWGNVLVQSMAAGVPVVVTRSAALAREVELYGAGLVIADEDPEELANAVHSILHGTSQDWATGGRQFVSDFVSDERQSSALSAAYELAAK